MAFKSISKNNTNKNIKPMAIRSYKFNYDHQAEVEFKVDTDKLTKDDAKLLLEFFIWDYDADADPIDEIMKKYAIACIKVQCSENLSLQGIKDDFENAEGFPNIDGSSGIEIVSISGYKFCESWLSMKIE